MPHNTHTHILPLLSHRNTVNHILLDQPSLVPIMPLCSDLQKWHKN